MIFDIIRSLGYFIFYTTLFLIAFAFLFILYFHKKFRNDFIIIYTNIHLGYMIKS